MISTRGRYALRVMIDLAEHRDEGYIPMKDVVASLLSHAVAVVDDGDDDVVALAHALHADGQLALGGHGVAHGVFHQRLNEERRNEHVLHLGRGDTPCRRG